MKQLEVGSSAPDFGLRNLEGRLFQLSEVLKEGPVVLVFYRASCPTSQFTLPFFQRIHTEARVRLIVISQDDAMETREFREHFGFTFDVVVDEHPHDVSAAYNLEYVPTIFVVGSDGKIQLTDYGFSKATLNTIAGHDIFSADDGIPSLRPG